MGKNPPANAGDVGSIPDPGVLFPVPCRVSVLSKSSVTSDENGNRCLLIHKVKQYNGVQSDAAMLSSSRDDYCFPYIL